MGVKDPETGEPVGIAYVLLEGPGEKLVALNQSTFLPAKSSLIKFDSKEYAQLRRKRDSIYYATLGIGKSSRVAEGDFLDHSNCIIPLGALLEETVKKLFPKTYEALAKTS